MIRPIPKLLLQYIIPKQLLTVFAGLLADIKIPWVKNYLIRNFIKKYSVNLKEALEEVPEAYQSFNDFFIRRLKPDARPIAALDIISPVDGFVSEFGAIQEGMLLQAKGRHYAVDALLAGHNSEAFKGGAFATLYLSPKDYHRVHMPLKGTLQEMIHVPGTLFSVQPLTTQHIPNLFTKNERLVLLFETEFGPMAVIMVGAVVVGKIGTIWQGELPRAKALKQFDVSAFSSLTLEKAAELGYFKLGSTAIVLFSQEVTWAKALKAGLPICLGNALGRFGQS